MKNYWGIANFISLGNALCGILSLFQSFSRHFEMASMFMLAAVAFDFLDGKTARLLGQATLFGKGLDCLSDIVSFGMAPAALGYAVLDPGNALLQTLLVIFVLAGIWRLAYFFQWTRAYRPPGMPITLNGLTFPVLVLARAPASAFPLAFGLSAILMVFPIFLSRPEIS